MSDITDKRLSTSELVKLHGDRSDILNQQWKHDSAIRKEEENAKNEEKKDYESGFNVEYEIQRFSNERAIPSLKQKSSINKVNLDQVEPQVQQTVKTLRSHPRNPPKIEYKKQDGLVAKPKSYILPKKTPNQNQRKTSKRPSHQQNPSKIKYKKQNGWVPTPKSYVQPKKPPKEKQRYVPKQPLDTQLSSQESLLSHTFGNGDSGKSFREKRKNKKLNPRDESESVGYTKIKMEGVDIDYSFPKHNPLKSSTRIKKQISSYKGEPNEIEDQSFNDYYSNRYKGETNEIDDQSFNDYYLNQEYEGNSYRNYHFMSELFCGTYCIKIHHTILDDSVASGSNFEEANLLDHSSGVTRMHYEGHGQTDLNENSIEHDSKWEKKVFV